MENLPALTEFKKQSLLGQACLAASRSHAPYSKQPCGAAVLTASGATYLGCTVDNAAYPNSSCAIRNAIANAISSDSEKFSCNNENPFVRACALISFYPGKYSIPCGVCRQALLEVGNFPVLLGMAYDSSQPAANENINFIETTVLQLMPYASLTTSVARSNSFTSDPPEWWSEFFVTKVSASDGLETDAIVQPLIVKAVEGAKLSYRPYSNFPVGAALATNVGIVTGGNVENESFQVCWCAERTAISKAIAAGATKIQAVAILCAKLEGEYAKPCGGCRQSLVEFGNVTVYCLQYLGKGIWSYQKHGILDMLPGAFAPSSLQSTAS